MSEARAILRRCDPELLDPHGDTEQLDCAEAESMVLSLMDSRRVQKVLWRQLFVLDSMMSLLEGLESAQQLMTQPCPPQPEGGARGRWKALKLESRSGVEQTEKLLRSLQEKIQQVQERRDTLTLLLQRLQDKKQQCEELATPLLTAHNALQSCDSELSRLRAESEAALCHLIGWQRLRDQLQAFVSATQEVMQINLVAFNQSELSVELKPLPSDDGSTNELEPLRLTVTWENEDRFRLQVDERTVSVVEEWQTGRWSELSAALLDVMQCYVGQYELLSEIQGLRSSFAIDWQPAQRVLVYLKTAVLVCRLHVEEGYPGNGGATLLSVRRDGQPLDTTALMTHHLNPSLTEWLVYLCSSPLL